MTQEQFDRLVALDIQRLVAAAQTKYEAEHEEDEE
jgi:hypothetical protein